MNLREALSGTLTKKEMQKLITSFDIIGDIAIIDIPRGLGKKQKKIGEALMGIHKNVKVVLKKASNMEGEYRVRKVKCIAGENRTTTEYRENDCRMKLDVAKVYFSVRLSHERERIADLVKDGEKILALFAGVGPFAFVIAKRKPKSKIIAIELNPVAVEYMKENIRLNKFEDRITPIKGDVKKIVPSNFRNFADRILMPLPWSSGDFLGAAFAGIKSGGTIHFYTFVKEDRALEEASDLINRAAKKSKVKTEIIFWKIVRPYAPGIVQVVIDFQVKK